MHELGMCEALMDSVQRRAAGRPVRRVRVRVGAQHRVVASSMDQAFSLASAGTVADGAAVDLVTVPVHVTCRTCGVEASSDDPLAVCPACGATEVELQGGDEFMLEALELSPAGPEPAGSGSVDPERGATGADALDVSEGPHRS